MLYNFKWKVLSIVYLFLLCCETTLIKAQCIPTSQNFILRQPGLYQLIGNVDGAFDTPTGIQGKAGGNTLNNGNWLNRGLLNLVTNGDFSLPGTSSALLIPNGTGGNGRGSIQLMNVPNWTINGNSINAYPIYGMNFNFGDDEKDTDFGASLINLYLGNEQYSVYTQKPIFNNGYAINSSSVNPYITSEGISLGYGQVSGDPITIQQTIATVVGAKYRLQFFVASERIYETNGWLMALDITGYARSILFVPGDTNIIRYEFEFKATSDSTTLKFINWGHSLDNTLTTEFVLDDIVVNAVPSACSVVPITLKSFEVKKISNTARLLWQTDMEENADYFEIDYSTDGNFWNPIGSVKANGTTFTTQQYTYTHIDLKPGTNYYRLRQVDKDGKFTYSQVRFIYISNKDRIVLTHNPNTNVVFITESPDVKISSISLFSNDGKKILALNNYINNINIQKYPAGLYVLRVIDNQGNSVTKKIIKK